MKHRKIGIFTGTFDPIHQGHIAFIQKALEQNKLDRVYVIPERMHRHKQNVIAYTHRFAMTQLALKQYSAVKVVDTNDEYVSLTTVQSLTHKDDELFLLLGTDVALTLRTWKNIDTLLARTRLIVGVRDENDVKRIHVLMQHMDILESQYSIVTTNYSSSKSSAARNYTQLFLPQITEYIQKHQLYTL